MHELPGLARQTVSLADRLVLAGYRVFLPHLFGRPMWDHETLASGINLTTLCISAEFARLAANETAPVTLWLRALARDISAWCNDGKIGAIGMCLSGGFIIPLILEREIGAPVTSQPAVPILAPFGTSADDRAALGVAPGDLAAAAARARRDRLTVLGFRFKADRKCPHDRFAHLSAAFGEQFEPHEFDSEDSRWQLGAHPHSVLTYERPDQNDDDDHPSHQALRRLLSFLHERL